MLDERQHTDDAPVLTMRGQKRRAQAESICTDTDRSGAVVRTRLRMRTYVVVPSTWGGCGCLDTHDESLQPRGPIAREATHT